MKIEPFIRGDSNSLRLSRRSHRARTPQFHGRHKTMRQKDNLEHHAVQNFIAEYNRTHKRQLYFLRPCQPPMPDTLCRLNKREIGIEVVHNYGSEVEAAIRVGGKVDNDFPEEVHRSRRITPLDVRTLNFLNEVLENKATKTYAFSPTWLLIRNAFVLWSLSEYRVHKHEIVVPGNHPFDQIWFLCDSNSIGRPRIMKLS